MTDFELYFESPDGNLPFDERTMGSVITKAWEDGYTFNKVEIALLGIPDMGQENAVDDHFSVFRNNFYTLAQACNKGMVIDLGNLKPGKTTRDTFFGLQHVVSALLRSSIVPVVFSPNESAVYGLYLAYQHIEKSIHHVSADYKLDNQPESTDIITQDNYIHQIIKEYPEVVEELSLIGTQAYFDTTDRLTTQTLSFNNERLGVIRQNIFDAESIVRDADMFTIDMNSIRSSDNPANTLGMPGGFYSEEICQIAWFAGYSDKVTLFGVFNHFQEFDRQNVSSHLVSQILWHFIEGFSSRPGDYPASSLDKYTELHVSVKSIDQELVFLRSDKSKRFWLKLNDGKKILPVSYKEYLDAVNNVLSDRLFRKIIHFKS